MTPSTLSVLHVDDPSFTSQSTTYFSRVDDAIEFTPVPDPDRALELLKTGEFDCVVSEYELPGMNGLEFLSAARAVVPDVPFIFVTEHGNETVASKAITAGVTGYFQKTGDQATFEVLANQIRHAVEKNRARRALEREHRLFKLAAEHTGHAVMITDRDGTIEYVNPAFTSITGFTAADAVGNNPRILKSGKMPDEYYVKLWQALLNGEVWTEEIVNRRKDGSLYVAHQTIAPIVEATGDIESFVAVQSDITELQEREHELSRQNERLEEFASVVSHDLRNPLAIAFGHLDFIENGDGHVEIVKEALDRMERIIEDTLTMAREGSTVTDRESVSLEDVARAAWTFVDNRNATLEVTEAVPLSGDRSRIQQLLENLFRNSLEHGRLGDDPITIRVGSTPTGFFVEDDGFGFPTEKRDRVLEHGYTTAVDGTGLGLNIVQQIAVAHGWSVSVAESEAGGARVEFTVDVDDPIDRVIV